ncbi:MAG: hypothetical protein HY699_16245 [Deltaproteobacteria bacterium]|nr:hypothetical protein [Deltaproteobacteria bacterium]
MRKVRWESWTIAVALLATSHGVRADVTSDQAAAIVVWPLVSVSDPAAPSLTPYAEDTLIQLSNTSSSPVEAHCFYLNANSHCTNDGSICQYGAQCCGGGGCGLCLPAWNETDFNIVLTPRQPIAWIASEGLSAFCTPTQTPGERCIPLDGRARLGAVDSSGRPTSNAGTRILPVPETPFVGELKCVAIDSDTGEPLSGSGANVLKGEATLENATGTRLDVGKYNAIGIRALADPVDDGRANVLTLQTEGGEYEGCPNVLIFNHFFDFATNPANTALQVMTWPVFVPCTQNLLQQIPGTAIAQYLVFNEFEQRFSTSNTVPCFRATGLSSIDTTQPANSIFSVGIAGSLVGQTRVTPIGAGLLAIQLESHGVDPATMLSTGQQADTNVHYQGRRASADVITLP